MRCKCLSLTYIQKKKKKLPSIGKSIIDNVNTNKVEISDEYLRVNWLQK